MQGKCLHLNLVADQKQETGNLIILLNIKFMQSNEI